MPRTIDPLALAQFMILPGAAELVEAFSVLPPGDVRDSVVSHAQVLARAAGWSPPVPFVMDPTGRVASAHEPKRLASPYAQGLSSKSLEGQIIERLMRGEADHLVADDLGVKLGDLVRLKAKARREGGLAFPGDDGIEAKPGKAWKTSVKKGKGGKTGKTLNLARMPLPEPPYWWEDPASPVWDNPRLLPTFSEVAEGSMAAVGPNDHRTFRTMELAAARHGLTLRQSIAQRLEIIRRIEAGEKPTDIALDLRIAPYGIYSLLTKIGRGRMEAMNARPLEAPEPEPLPQAIPEPRPAQAPAAAAPRRSSFRSQEAAEKTARAVREQAAARWGFANVESYLHMREQVRDIRMTGVGATEIATRLDMPILFVKGALQSYRREHGIVFPEAPMPKRKVA